MTLDFTSHDPSGALARLGVSSLRASLCLPTVFGLALVAVAACDDPCDEDAFGCSDGNEFVIAPSCDLLGDLSIRLGQGSREFQSLAPAQEPTLHQGNQGGQHFLLGVRIAEPALDFPLVKLTLDAEVFDPDRCQPNTECDPWVGSGSRELVLGPELGLNDDGDLEQTSLLLVISIWPLEFQRRLRVSAIDACERDGAIEHVLAAQ